MKLVLLHGWAFDAGLWRELVPLLPSRDVVLADRGYFGEPCEPLSPGPHLVVAHSLGSMQALCAPSPECAGMVAINGFDCFAAQAGYPGVPVRVVDRMLARLDEAPDRVVAEFRLQCWAAEAAPVVHREVLRGDLAFLRDGDCRAQSSTAPFSILSLHGQGDPILPAALREATFASAGRLQQAVCDDGAHLLPFTHAQWCADRIAQFMRELA